MLISIDIERVRDHIPILQKEQREAQELVDFLSLRLKQGTIQALPDMERVEAHLRTANNHLSSIQRRRSLLEAVIDEVVDLKRATSDIFSDAAERASASGWFL